MLNQKTRQIICSLGLFLVVIAQVYCTRKLPSEILTNSNVSERHNEIMASSQIEKVNGLPMSDLFVGNIQFINEQDGWYSWKNQLWRTSDGGRSWEDIYTSNDEHFMFVGFEFINSLFGWSYSSTTLYKTTDGGHTWVRSISPIERYKGSIGALRFMKDGLRGWITGGLYQRMPIELMKNGGIRSGYINGNQALQGVIFYTEDGGKTWQQQDIPTEPGSFISHIYVSRHDQIWATGNTNLYKGVKNHWKKIDFTKAKCINQQLLTTIGLTSLHGDISDIMDLSFGNIENGWLSFENGYIAKSTDGGSTWCDLFIGQAIQEGSTDSTTIVKLYFIDSNSGWGFTRNGRIYRTKDGGSTWEKLGTSTSFNDIYFLDAKHVWATSKEGLFRILP